MKALMIIVGLVALLAGLFLLVGPTIYATTAVAYFILSALCAMYVLLSDIASQLRHITAIAAEVNASHKEASHHLINTKA